MKKILLVEDDDKIAELVEFQVKKLGFEMLRASDGKDGLDKALNSEVDLVVLDLMLPELDGIEVCKEIRKKDDILPIIMLTAQSTEMDKIIGLEVGADDYMTKPFSPMELASRIKAVLRRTAISDKIRAQEPKQQLTVGGLSIDFEMRRVVVDGEKVALSPIEYDLLSFLASRPGRPFARDELLIHVWDLEYSGYEQTVSTCINRLRSKIEKDPSQPKYVLTEWGYGYRFVDPSEFEA